jgi:hypothetical protein
MPTIKQYANSLLNVAENGLVILKKTADDISILKKGGESLYDLVQAAESSVTRTSPTAQAALELIPENSGESASEWDHPIVDELAVQKGFDGSEDLIGYIPCAESKAVLSAEGQVVREGTVVHAQYHAEFNSTTGIGETSLIDPQVAKGTRGNFAKRKQTAGFDEKTQKNTKRVNASGLTLVAPFDPFNPANPDAINHLAAIAGGIAYSAAMESFYSDVDSMSEDARLYALLVTTRNANAAYLDRLASDYFVQRGFLDLSKKIDKARHMNLLKAFRANRNRIGAPANNVLATTMTLGVVKATYVYSPTMIWTSEKKLARLKKLVDASNNVFYMAPSYDQAGCATVPVRLDKLSPSIKAAIQVLDIAAGHTLNNEARNILGLPVVEYKSPEYTKLDSYIQTEIPTVAEALHLHGEDVAAAKSRIMEEATKLMKEIYEAYDEAVTSKAAEKFVQDQLG